MPQHSTTPLLNAPRLAMALASCAAIAFTAVTCSADEPADLQSPVVIGANLDQVLDYSAETPFVDLFKTARAWISQQEGEDWGEGPPLDLSPDGQNPLSLRDGQFATTLICCRRGIPSGRYTCLYDGRGRIEFEGDAQFLEERPGRIVVAVEAPGEILLHIRQTDPTNPVRRIRFIMPGHEDTYEQDPFYPPFLQQKAMYRVLRFMDWQRTNDSTIRSWSDRPQKEDSSQAHRGVAIGWMVAVANRLHSDPWFCIPHQADDDYVRRFAEEVVATLDPDRTIYIEYSNEVWNGGFEQCEYAQKQGTELGLSDDPQLAGYRFYAKRAVEVFAIWEDVFGGTDRFVRVISGQEQYPTVAAEELSFRDTAKHADAVAIAAYFGGDFGSFEDAARVDELSVDDAISACARDLSRLQRDVEANAAIARHFGLPLIAYEGGQHLRPQAGAEDNQRLTDLIIAANRDARMKDLYEMHLADWQAAGGQLYVAYKSICEPSEWGAWGLLEYEGQDPAEAPKYQAIKTYLSAFPKENSIHLEP